MSSFVLLSGRRGNGCILCQCHPCLSMHNVARRVKCVPNLGSVLASLPDSHASLCHTVSPPPPFPGNEAESVFHLCGIITAVLLSSVCVGLISSQHSWSVVFSQLWRSVLHYCVVCYITSYLIHRRGTFCAFNCHRSTHRQKYFNGENFICISCHSHDVRSYS